MPGTLEGRRILVLRPADQAADLVRTLEATGATPVAVPAIRILPPQDWAPIEAALRAEHDWVVFTSVNGVAAVAQRLDPATIRARIAAIGPATAAALADHGVPVDYIPSAYTTFALARGLPGPPGRVLLLRAEIAGLDLEEVLVSRGFNVARVDAYRTEPTDPGPLRAALGSGVDGVALTSASIAEAFAAAAGDPPDTLGAAVFSIGPATSAACRRVGLPIAAEAATHTIPGLVGAIATHLGPAGGAQ